jgi:hypothetical protein
MIGTTLDFGDTDRYVLVESLVRNRPVLVGSQTYSRAGSTLTVTINFSLTGGTNTTPQAGDIVVLCYSVGSTVAATPQAPAGYTTIAAITRNDTYDVALYVGYKVMGATPDTTFQIPTSSSADNAQAAAVFVWRGVEGLDVTSVTAVGIDGRAANPPAITPVTENSVIMAIGASGHVGGSTPVYTSSDLTGFRTIGANDTYDTTIGAGYFNWVSGTFDPAAFAIGGSTTSDAWAAVTLALRPILVNESIYGNYKNSGVWDIRSLFEQRASLPQATPEYTVFAGGISTVDSTNLTVPFPVGIQAGDLLIIDGYVNANAVASTPSGWAATFNEAYHPCFFKTATGSETGSVTVPKNTTTTTARAQMYVVRVTAGYTAAIKATTGGYAGSSTYTPLGLQYNGYDLNIAGFGYSTSAASAVTGFTNLISVSGWSSWYRANYSGDVTYTSPASVNYRHLVININ